VGSIIPKSEHKKPGSWHELFRFNQNGSQISDHKKNTEKLADFLKKVLIFFHEPRNLFVTN
jgi:hypothetical protein